MVSKSTDSAPKMKKSNGEKSMEGIGSLTQKMNQLKKQIQAERAVSVKERIETNRKKIEGEVAELISATTSKKDLLPSSSEQSSVGKMIAVRSGSPLCRFNGFGHEQGSKDSVSAHEISPSKTTKLPFVERIPPYTTWMFLERNQRMAEDQSVVGRRRIYYDDQHGSEALICSDSEDDTIEPEEEKHEFSDGEDRIIWMVFNEYGLADEVLNILSQFIGVTTSEIQGRCNALKEKYDEEKNVKDSGISGSDRGIPLEKSLSAALDSFDNLFCRLCLLFDCRLHGCSHTLINPSEKHPYWSEYEDDRTPCSDQCCLRLRTVKSFPESSINNARLSSKTATLEEEKQDIVALDTGEASCTDGGRGLVLDDGRILEKEISVSSEAAGGSELATGVVNLDTSNVVLQDQEHTRKRKASQHRDTEQDATTPISDDFQESSVKKQKKSLVLNDIANSVDGVSNLDQISIAQSPTKIVEVQMTVQNKTNESASHKFEEFICSSSKEHTGDKAKAAIEAPEPSQSSSAEEVLSMCEWKPIEKELYVKGVEIFGKNSCLIARNLLSGLKTCIEVSKYMCDNGATPSHRSIAPSSYLNDNGRTDTDYADQEIPTRSRLLRRRGRTRKLKYSWKSAGHPSFWKRIADGKNQSCKQYTPCGCQSMCGKQCSCLNNGTCCEKYCGCSKSCKNRFRGCHCAKSQCRSRQCPCFAAGRECDPDVCRNCWVSCGDGSLGEPPKRGDGQCGNMRLLLRQQQRILLAKSDVAGWGAFLKNAVNKNDYLGEYTGELISHREADKRGKIYDRANSSFLFDLNDQYVLDAYRKGDKLKFANHSSNPNCYAKVMLVAGDHRVGIFAKEHIEASEELFYDYRYGPDQAPAWARKPEGSKRDDLTASQGRAKKHQSH